MGPQQEVGYGRVLCRLYEDHTIAGMARDGMALQCERARAWIRDITAKNTL